jgi:hypothetical protein
VVLAVSAAESLHCGTCTALGTAAVALEHRVRAISAAVALLDRIIVAAVLDYNRACAVDLVCTNNIRSSHSFITI